MSPRKVRLLVDMVRGKKVGEAISQLTLTKKHAARPVQKLIESAVANARHNHNMAEETLVVKAAFVDEGKTLYRWMPRAFGRATPIRKRTSHITVVIEGDATQKEEKQHTVEKVEAKKESRAPKKKVAVRKKKASDKTES